MTPTPIRLALAGALALVLAAAAGAQTMSDEDVAKVQALRCAGKFDEATQLVKGTDAFAAKDMSALALVGLIQFDQGKVIEAEATITSVHPFGSYMGSDPRTWLLLGHLQTNRFARPEQHLEKSGEARLLPLARTYLDRAALAMKDDPELALAYARNRALQEGSIAALQDLLAFEARQAELPHGMFARFVPECALIVARKVAAGTDYDDATVACLKEAVRLAPDDFVCRWTYARALVETDRTDEAKAQIESIKKDFAEHVGDAEYLNARIFERKGDFEQALQHANNAVFLTKSRYVPALEAAARCEFAVGNFDRMKVHLERVRSLDPRSRDLYTLLARFYMQAAEKREDPGDREHQYDLAEQECLTGLTVRQYDLELLELVEKLYALRKKERTDEDRKILANKLKLARAKAAEQGR
jgi:hypothetical protein